MSTSSSSSNQQQQQQGGANADECSICLTPMVAGAPILTTACNHKFHFSCLTANIQAQNNECPLCRASLSSLSSILRGPQQQQQQQQQQYWMPAPYQPAANQNARIPFAPIQESNGDRVNEEAVRELAARVTAARQSAAQGTTANNQILQIDVRITLEYGGQDANKESNIYGLVTLKAPSLLQSQEEAAQLRVPLDLVCVVDNSGSMAGEKMALLKVTLQYIIDQMLPLDRLAIVSFDTHAVDRSHGFKLMTPEKQNILKASIQNELMDGGGTFIGAGLSMGIGMLTGRQTKNPLAAMFLLTDGQDNNPHDYTELMARLPAGVPCHSFGYGPDHWAAALVRLAEQGHGGTFTYIDEQQAVGPSFATALGGLFSCIAQDIQVKLEFENGYRVTNVHSTYPYEPTQLPSTTLTFKLNDLNEEEKRNLIFQLYVPKDTSDQAASGDSAAEPMSQSQDQEAMSQSQDVEPKPNVVMTNNAVGRVVLSYKDANSGNGITTEPAYFNLVRQRDIPADSPLLEINYQLDVQRNRVETARILQTAANERDYKKALDMLKQQVEKIKASKSAADVFCVNLIKDLQHHYPSQQAFQSSHQNAYMQHAQERGTYSNAQCQSSNLAYHNQQQMFQQSTNIRYNRR